MGIINRIPKIINNTQEILNGNDNLNNWTKDGIFTISSNSTEFYVSAWNIADQSGTTVTYLNRNCFLNNFIFNVTLTLSTSGYETGSVGVYLNDAFNNNLFFVFLNDDGFYSRAFIYSQSLINGIFTTNYKSEAIYSTLITRTFKIIRSGTSYNFYVDSSLIGTYSCSDAPVRKIQLYFNCHDLNNYYAPTTEKISNIYIISN